MNDNDQQTVISFLADPATHGGSPVERIDTHAAIVFLTHNRAYKLKRAIRLPYLDFSTPGQRQRMCEAEYRLNRRTAPRLYLGVRPIGRDANGMVAFDAGQPLDWVVEMRRFPADALFARLVDTGRLELPLVHALADEIARFHNAAPRATTDDGRQRLGAVIEGNLHSMMAIPPGILAPADITDLYENSLTVLDRHGQLLDQRAADGHVRRCHGDLHLGNICLFENRPTLFDCLEFDENLGTIDTLYDLAFLVMDLGARGQWLAASALLNRYCDHAGMATNQGLPALSLFLSVRAAIRAHVSAAAIATQDSASSAADLRCRARNYMALALSFLGTASSRLVAVGGLSGTGKSTLAARLAPVVGQAPGARILRSDVIRKQLAGVAPEQPLPPENYTPETTARVYSRLCSIAAALLARGVSVIADAVFAAPDERAAIAGAAGDARFDGLWLEASHALLRQRVERRHGDASDADVRVVDQQQGYAIGDVAPWHRIMADGDRDDIVARAQHIIS